MSIAVCNFMAVKLADMDDLIQPVIDMATIDCDTAIAEQEEFLLKLTKLHGDLMRMNETHFHERDTRINKYLDKVLSQVDRIGALKTKLEAMQKRVQSVENTYKKLKDDIPELKKNALLSDVK